MYSYELHVDREKSAQLYKDLQEAGESIGIQPFGNYALNSLRIEMGFMVKADLDYAHYTEAGIEELIVKIRGGLNQFIIV